MLWKFLHHETQFHFDLQNCFSNSKFLLKYKKPFSLVMTVPTNITEPPMGHTEQESHLESKGEEHFIPMHLIQHVFQTVMGLFNDGQFEKLSHWIQFRGYGTFDDMYDDFCHNPEDDHKYEDFEWNGVKDHIGPNIVLKIKGFTKWMNLKKGISIIYDHFLFSLDKRRLY